MNRRRFLATVGLLGATGVAGCVGGQPADSDPTPTASPDGPPRTFSVTSTRCGTQADRAEVTVDAGAVTVEGTTWGNDACYTGRLESVAWDGETLTIRVAAERRPDAQGCAQCITEIDYRATVEVDRPPAEVVVVHRGERVAVVRP